MKVVLKQPLKHDGHFYGPGETVDVKKEIATQLLAAGLAEEASGKKDGDQKPDEGNQGGQNPSEGNQGGKEA